MTWALATIAGLLIAYAALSRRLDSFHVSAAMFFTTTGLVAGPVLGLIDVEQESHDVKLLAEITLTLVLFSDASRISLPSFRGEYGVPVRLLGIGLPLTIAAGAAVGAFVIPGVTLVEALVLAVMLAATDAALGKAVVTDERLPSSVRQGLNVESGLNDGLCVPLFLIAIAIAEADAGEVTGRAAVRVVFEQIGYGAVAGIAAGLLGMGALRLAVREGARSHWKHILTAAAALLAAGIAHGLGGSIFIAAFVAGFVFAVALPRDEAATQFVDEGGELFGAVTFTVFGAAILGTLLDEVTWELVLYAVLSLTVVRMLPVALALAGTGAARPTRLFVGWFGPRGLASVVFGVILLDDSSLEHERTLLIAGALTIALSVYAHGFSAGPLTERYLRAVARDVPTDARSTPGGA